MKTRMVQLGELGEIVSGSTPRTGVPEYWDGDIPWVTPADLSNHDGIFFSGKPRKITEAGYRNCSASILPPGSILFSSRAPIGHSAVTSYPLCTNQGFKSIVPNERIDPVYGYFALKFLTPSIITKGRGATFAEVNMEIMETVELPLPSLTDQRRIAGMLEQADRLRRTRRYALDLSDTFLPAAFLEMFGDLECGRGRWPLHPFDEVCKISDKLVDPKEDAVADLPQVSSEDIESISGDLGVLRTARQKSIISVNFLVEPNEILFSKIRPKLRKVAYPERRVLCSADIYPIGLVSSQCTLHYLLFYLRSRFFSWIVERLAEARCNIPKVNRDELSEQFIPVPPLSLQQRFADLVRRHERLRAAQRESLRQAEHLFQALLSRAFK